MTVSKATEHRWRRVALGVVACAGMMSCTGTRTSGSATDDLHDQLVAEAENDYELGPMTASVSGDPLTIGNSEPEKSIRVYSAKMIRKELGQPEPHRFVAAFFSTKNYSRLGLRRGINYVFIIPRGTKPPLVVMVSEEKDKMFYLKVKTTNLSHASDQIPHAVHEDVSRDGKSVGFVIGGCIEGCQSGHCGVTDTDGAFTGFVEAAARARDSMP